MGFRAAVKRSKSATVAYYLQKDLRARVGSSRSINVSTGGYALAPSAAEAYAQAAFNGILKHGRLSPTALKGLRVLELGPGDSLGTARMMADHGAHVVAIDRFSPTSLPGGFEFFAGVGVEDAVSQFGEASFDLIYSIAVLEHVAELGAAFDAMYRLLRPGARLAHAIGGGDHGMFSDGGHHPLTYMTIPTSLYRLMTAHSGGPNRVLPFAVRRIVERYDWEWSLTVGNVLGVASTLDPYVEQICPAAFPEQTALVEAARSRLREPFRSLPVSELLVEGSFFAARKRG
jgi:SAM-dependent methyltransferase